MTARKNELWDWFQEAVTSLGVGHEGLMKGWDLASEHLDSAETASWKCWVASSVSKALARAHTNPVGLWLGILRDGPVGDLTKPATKAQTAQAAHAIRAAETDAYISEIKATPRTSAPSLVAVCELQAGGGMTYAEALAVVSAEWERQGQPWPEDFDRARLGLEVAR